jgi:AcrR family transcriptional regulator
MESRKPAAPGATPRRSARQRLLQAAGELFYEEGINTVGIDRVIERAGVAKASLYDAFGSKDELIRAYLAERQEVRRARMTERLARYRTPREKLLGVFDYMADLYRNKDFHGCAFGRASAELKPGCAGRQVIEEARAWTLDLFTGLAKEAGAVHPDRLARQLVLLYDGSMTAAQIDHNPDGAAMAKAMAAQLLDAALPARRSK